MLRFIFMQIENYHLLLEILTPIFLGLAAWSGLLIRASLGEVRLEQKDAAAKLLEGQVVAKEEMNQKHAENKEAITAHVAEDRVQFKFIEQQNAQQNTTLERIEGLIRNGGPKPRR
jgi:hypothetical protein